MQHGRSRLGGLVWRAPLLCGVLMVMEGLDSNVISFVGPLIAKERQIGTAALAWVYVATVICSLAGAAGIAPLSDRYGRRRLIIGSAMVMTVCTVATMLAQSGLQLLLARGAVGLAFGAAVPCAMALTADYAPAARRSLLVMIVIAGVALGYVVAGIASAVIIPASGWRSLMEANAALSLLCTAALVAWLPESRRLAGIGIAEVALPKPSELIGHLFGRRTAVLLFLLVATYAVEYLLSFWLPALLMRAGASMALAGYVTAAAKAGSIIGGILAGWLMDRLGRRRVLATSLCLGAAMLLLLSRCTGMPVAALVAVVLVSFFVDASFSGSQALAVGCYPERMRGTAMGWLTGIGRVVGGGLGTLSGGYFIAWGVGPVRVSMLLAGSLLAAALVLLALQRGATIETAPAASLQSQA